ncbi:MAG: SpoIIE family protein phosphatase [Acidobacteriota bacterium]
MTARWRTLLGRVGLLDRIFLVALVAAGVCNVLAPRSGWGLVLTLAAVGLAIAVAFKWTAIGLKRAIWRLRYRLLVAYLFIAVVPIVLLIILVWFGSTLVAGQAAAYVATTELERLTSDMLMPARGLAWTAPEARAIHARWVAPAFWNRYPGLEISINDGKSSWRYPADATLTQPPAGWGDASGLVRREGKLYLWAHAVHGSAEVTIAAPVTQRTLAELAPNLAAMELHRNLAAGAEDLPEGGAMTARVPPAENMLDAEVPWLSLVPVAVWEAPGSYERDFLYLRTRYSAVLRTIFGRQTEWRQGETLASSYALWFLALAVVLLIAEIVSIVIGLRLSRSITGAVHNLYQGTEHIRTGDFSHRIEVRGNDQLAGLGRSFNRMTEDLERLVEVAKEKERLQSEIEIAREVQNQLFPKSLPASSTLELAAACLPARLVSGDYYDYMNLDAPSLALAIGDVAGKGISAALLMATVQSTMRTQLRAGRELAAAAGDGGHTAPFSSATLVSRLNQQLFAFTPPEKFATFFFALYDDVTGLLTYTNAGHLPPILVRGGEVTRLDVTGTVVGAFSFAQYGESSVRLEPGDLLVAFTDGVTEPENEFGEMFGEDRLSELVVKHAGSESSKIIGAVMESVQQWTGSPELQDDMTLLLARRV